MDGGGSHEERRRTHHLDLDEHRGPRRAAAAGRGRRSRCLHGGRGHRGADHRLPARARRPPRGRGRRRPDRGRGEQPHHRPPRLGPRRPLLPPRAAARRGRGAPGPGEPRRRHRHHRAHRRRRAHRLRLPAPRRLTCSIPRGRRRASWTASSTRRAGPASRWRRSPAPPARLRHRARPALREPGAVPSHEVLRGPGAGHRGQGREDLRRHARGGVPGRRRPPR